MRTLIGPFHTQCCMIYAIYKRHKKSELAEVLVAAGVIADGSVDHALRGKHYRRALPCFMLTYGTLTHRLVRRHIPGGGFDPTRQRWCGCQL